MEQLVDKRCVPCEGGTPPLSRERAEDLRKQTPDWEIVDNRIERTFKFPDFVQAMDFANRITQIAQEQNHHPNLHISWGRVRVELWTHAAGGLTENDFILAAKIDRL